MTITYNALSGALAAQAALNTVSQNLANVQTPGYTRQGVLLKATASDPGTLSAGNGVQIGSLLRFSNTYQLQQMWRANSDLGAHAQTQPYLSALEKVMSDDQSSISYGVDNFFKALNAAGVDPTSSPLRQQVVTTASSMAQQFNSIYNVAANQVVSVNQQQQAILPSLNESLAGIALLNKQIVSVGGTGTNTSALMDKREQLIDSVSSQVGVDVVYNPNGSVNVSLKNGEPLVMSDAAANVAYSTESGSPVLQLTYAGVKFNLDDSQVGGQLGGLGDFKKNTLIPLQTSVKELADQVAQKINDALAGGYTSAGAAGGPMFEVPASTGIMQVSAGFTSGDLAFSGDGTPGDSSNLQNLIAVKGQSVTLTSLGNTPVVLSDADTQLVGKLGIQSQQNQSLLATATTVRSQAEDDWKSTSAVNSDEEGINLVEFQNMYQANMKVIAVANTLFDATLQMFG
ncbi:flagellar hook-associated protein FlgK [Duganella levis]|uniref:Flagellar hook-associated protein 1 n=1 Tax=Duganella levis TaxID=2692169 RepID=A0ABW9VYQ8_9BURK|nr:flagellar hook-associated protein FlgK [Duganella levis]MYN26667.1 flagellar hook-associated protein FlgK [Duganella levis]